MSLSLIKGQRIDLTKGSALKKIFLGLGWDVADDDDEEVDIDASCVLLGAQKRPVDDGAVFFANLENGNGSIRHGGDNLTGDGDGDDEVIEVDLADVPAEIEHLVFVITSYSGHTFNQVRNAFCRVVDAVSRRELARYAMSGAGHHRALIAARVYRHQGDWKMQALGVPADGVEEDCTFADIMDDVVRAF